MAIKAHLDPRSAEADGTSGQRIAARRALRLETSGILGDAGEANVTVHNISASGMLVETALDLEQGDVLAIDLPEAGVVAAAVVWSSGSLYGCAFDADIGPATLAAVQLQGFAPEPANPGPAPRTRGPAEALGPRLNRLRREAGLTLADVAGALGVSKPTVWAWEKGKARPLPERLEAIAAALGADPALLAPAPGGAHEVEAVIAECRQRIADACGTEPRAVRIMIEL